MKHIVIHPFKDSEDIKRFPTGREYAIGDVFPFGKLKVSDERIKQLSSISNKARKVLIKPKKDDA